MFSERNSYRQGWATVFTPGLIGLCLSDRRKKAIQFSSSKTVKEESFIRVD
jgi:hypothetical protein